MVEWQSFCVFRFYQVFTTHEVVSRRGNKTKMSLKIGLYIYCIAIKGQKELFCGAKLHMYIRSIQLLKVVGILELGI